MSKLDTITYRIDIGLCIGLRPDENFTIKKTTDTGDILVTSPEFITQLGKPVSLDGLAERYPLAGQIDLSTGRTWHFSISSEQALPPRRINLSSADVYSYLQTVSQGKSAGMLSNPLCEPYLKSGQPVRLFPKIEIQKWQLSLYRPYKTVTPPRVLKVFEALEGILKREFRRQLSMRVLQSSWVYQNK